MGDVGFLLAFVAGVLSFMSPCVLALAPGYVFMLTGMTRDNQSGAEPGPWYAVLPGALAYTLGFSLVFISFGAAASELGHFLRTHRELLVRGSGLLVVVFGLQTAGLMKLGPLNRQRTPLMGVRRYGIAGCLLTGVAFAFGWSPCVGPILGTILTIAGSGGDVARGIGLLAVYSVGLALPFLTLAVCVGKARPVVSRVLKASLTIERVSGAVLVAIGLLMVTDRFYLLSSSLMELAGAWTPDKLAEGFVSLLHR